MTPYELAPALTVSRMGFGAMQLPGFGVWGPPADRAAAIAVLRRAIELGVTHVDTSDAYGPHVANDLIREALHPYPAELVIATKVGVTRDDNAAFVAAATPEALHRQIEANLTQLGLDRLDVVYLRVGGDGLLTPDETPLAEAFGALAELRDRGLVAHLALSGVTLEQLAEARTIAPVVAVQNRFHLLDRAAHDVLDACAELDIAFVPYFPLAAGLLRENVDKSLAPPGMATTDEQDRTLDDIATRHDATRAQVALAWLLALAPNVLAIPGTSSVAHLEENVAAAALELDPAAIKQLDDLSSHGDALE